MGEFACLRICRSPSPPHRRGSSLYRCIAALDTSFGQSHGGHASLLLRCVSGQVVKLRNRHRALTAICAPDPHDCIERVSVRSPYRRARSDASTRASPTSRSRNSARACEAAGRSAALRRAGAPGSDPPRADIDIVAPKAPSIGGKRCPPELGRAASRENAAAAFDWACSSDSCMRA